MSTLTLLGHHWRRHRVALVMLCVGMGLFEWIATRVVPSAEQANFLAGLLSMAPPPVRQMMSDQMSAVLAPRGFLAFFYVHPFPLLLLAIWGVRVPSAALAREVGQGTMDIVASRPVTRHSQVAAALVATLAGLAVMLLSGWAGTVVGLALRPVPDLGAAAYLPVAAVAWLLFAAFGAVALLVSTARRDGGSAIAITAGVIAVSFVFDYLARIWQPITGLRPLSLFRYYDPQAVMRAGVAAGDVAVLAAVAVVATVAAFVVFARRDL